MMEFIGRIVVLTIIGVIGFALLGVTTDIGLLRFAIGFLLVTYAGHMVWRDEP